MKIVDLFTPAQVEALKDAGLMEEATRCLIKLIDELGLPTGIAESLLEGKE